MGCFSAILGRVLPSIHKNLLTRREKSMRQRFSKLLFFGLLLGLVMSQPAWADDVNAKIHGTVTDPTGAVISGAQVTATNTATGRATTVTSQSTGLYEF